MAGNAYLLDATTQTRRLHTMQHHYEQWNRNAPLGLICIGAGLSLVTHAAALKNQGRSFWVWAFLGTVGLVIVNSGVAIFGDSVKHRALYEGKMDRLMPER